MSIPVQTDDSDEIFSRLVVACKTLQESAAAQAEEIRGLRDALEWIAKEPPCEGLYAGGEGYLAFACRLKTRARDALTPLPARPA